MQWGPSSPSSSRPKSTPSGRWTSWKKTIGTCAARAASTMRSARLIICDDPFIKVMPISSAGHSVAPLDVDDEQHRLADEHLGRFGQAISSSDGLVTAPSQGAAPTERSKPSSVSDQGREYFQTMNTIEINLSDGVPSSGATCIMRRSTTARRCARRGAGVSPGDVPRNARPGREMSGCGRSARRIGAAQRRP